MAEEDAAVAQANGPGGDDKIEVAQPQPAARLQAVLDGAAARMGIAGLPAKPPG